MLRPREPGWLTEDQEGTNVFIPGLMGAGLLVSMAMLVADGIRKVDPLRSQATRERAVALHAEGRARDIAAVPTGHHAEPPKLEYERRGRLTSVIAGVIGLVVAVAVVWWSITIYYGTGSVLSDRGWTVGGGVLIALLLAVPGFVLLASGASGRAAPAWLARLSQRPVLGRPVPLTADRSEV